MSYCRWSSDDFGSDVYTYEDVNGGWTTHVAGRRHDLTGIKLPPPVDPRVGDREAWVRQWYQRHVQVMRLIKDVPMVDIGLPYDGEKFSAETPGEAADQLEHLRATGYQVPQDAIDQLRKEEAEGYRWEDGAEEDL